MRCDICPLQGKRRVPGTGQLSSLMIIGEAPGQEEERTGKPFVGDSGQELNAYLHRAGISRELVYITNVVKCRPAGNKTPGKVMVDCCCSELEQEITMVKPRVVAAIGAIATQYFLGDAPMEYVHGLPYTSAQYPGITVVPCYHPAAAMRNTVLMAQVDQDVQMLGRVLRQEPGIVVRQWPGQLETVIALPTRDAVFALDMHEHMVVAIDTETTPDDKVICVTYTVDGMVGYRVDVDECVELRRLAGLVQHPDVLTVMHNILFDLPKLQAIGIWPKHYTDTMSMAYLLQDLPLGLKPLAYRLLNMPMASYKSVIGPYTQQKALDWIGRAMHREYEDPEPEVWIDKSGNVRVRRRKNIGKLLRKVYADWLKQDVDLFGRISKLTDLPVAEAAIGRLQYADVRDVDYEQATQYACADAIATYRVYQVLWPRVQENHLEDVLDRDMRIVPSVVEMWQTGFCVDVAHFQKLTAEFEQKKQEQEAQVKAMTGETVNLNSPMQVAGMLHKAGVFQSPTQSTSVKSLDKCRSKHPAIVEPICRYRGLSKLIGTYTEALPRKVNDQGRITTRLSITRTTTGRLASSNPNLMNIPARTKEGKGVRNGFIASPGCVLASNDYSQIEMRVAAHMSMDPKMIQIFKSGVDIHAQTASWMFDISMDKVDKIKHRYPAKRVGFGILYGLSAKGLLDQFLSEGMIVTEEECKGHIARWFAVFEGVKEFMDRMAMDARRYHRTWDLFGRYRLVPEMLSALPRIRSAGLRQAGNNPVQSGAQGVIKEAMARLYEPIVRLRQGGRYVCRFVVQIHDDLVFEISEEIREEAQAVIKGIMENAVELVVDTPVDSKWAYRWGEL